MRTAKKRLQKVCIPLVIILVTQSLSGCMEQTPSSLVTGRIIAEDGSGIPHVRVIYVQKEGFTDEEGYFSIEKISPGVDKLSVSKEGYIEMVIVVEAVADQSIDVGTVILLEKYGDIIKVEELTEYVPDPADDVIIVEYTAKTMNITALVTSTRSAFVIENGGAVGVVFDFSEKTKEVYMGDIVFTAAFGDEWDVHIVLEDEIVWSSEDDEEFQGIFSEMEESALEFVKSIGNIAEDSVHPDILVQARKSEEYINVLTACDGYFHTGLNPEKRNVHIFEKESAAYTEYFLMHSALRQLEFVSTLVYGLKWGITRLAG